MVRSTPSRSFQTACHCVKLSLFFYLAKLLFSETFILTKLFGKRDMFFYCGVGASPPPSDDVFITMYDFIEHKGI